MRVGDFHIAFQMRLKSTVVTVKIESVSCTVTILIELVGPYRNVSVPIYSERIGYVDGEITTRKQRIHIFNPDTVGDRRSINFYGGRFSCREIFFRNSAQIYRFRSYGGRGDCASQKSDFEKTLTRQSTVGYKHNATHRAYRFQNSGRTFKSTAILEYQSRQHSLSNNGLNC